MLQPSQIINQMMQQDAFSNWLGIERISEGSGFCKLQMKVRAEMCNGFGIAHGGISYSIADSALAFASNSLGRHSLSIETSISHFKRIDVGDLLLATAKQVTSGNRIATYQVEIHNQLDELVALFKGTVYIKDLTWS